MILRANCTMLSNFTISNTRAKQLMHLESLESYTFRKWDLKVMNINWK